MRTFSPRPARVKAVEIAAEHLARVERLLAGGGRRLLGLVGPPGAGKSTVAAELAAALGERAQVVPMDGFHLANVELARLGRADRKGAPDTFDAVGYAALLRRLREQRADEIVYAPEFRREIEEPIAGAIAVLPATQLVITEGNYLLLDEGPWAGVAALLDETWYVDLDDTERRRRLVERHMRFGRGEAAALDWVANTDEPNARRIAATRGRATCVIVEGAHPTGRAQLRVDVRCAAGQRLRGDPGD
ncbi:MAG: nucleoside/nucleotide kinase family protein [Piscinibacter sp.]|nr:nucleoside/nucleotide kinase family protein [Piscinibacter sp.]